MEGAGILFSLVMSILSPEEVGTHTHGCFEHFSLPARHLVRVKVESVRSLKQAADSGMVSGPRRDPYSMGFLLNAIKAMTRAA